MRTLTLRVVKAVALLVTSWVGLASTAAPVRSRSGLQALYSFAGLTNATVPDRAPLDIGLDLHIADAGAVRMTDMGLEVRSPTVIGSFASASRIADAIRVSDEVTLEAWISSAHANQSGPARIISISNGTSTRNITLGQDGDRYDVRVRTTESDANGLPSIHSTPGRAKPELTHVVFTRDRSGRSRIYVNGRLEVERFVTASTANWDTSYSLNIANEATRDRPWLGSVHLVAIYNRDLLPGEIAQHFSAGPRMELEAGSAEPTLAGMPRNSEPDSALLFKSEIAPLLATHCLECHDSASRKGRIDLSRPEGAFAAGGNGRPIVPFNSAESLVWQQVQSNDMPEDRPPLSDREKEVLRAWIDGGAVWEGEVIDPANYRQRHGATGSLLRRLTVTEYIETVRSSTGVDIAAEARRTLPKDVRADGFSNTSYNLTVDLGHIEAYARLAGIIIEQMDVPAFVAELAKPHQVSPGKLREVVAATGKWLLRGPLNKHELTVFLGIASGILDYGADLNHALAAVIEAMLQSPRFIYLVENQRGDGTRWPVGDYELASRLSYLIWGGPPDRELMRAVDAGELYDRRGIPAQVTRMLRDPRAIERSVQFIDEWLDLDRLEALRPDPGRYPNWSPGLARDMRRETHEFFREIAWRQGRSLGDLFNARFTFLTPALARHYGITPTAEGMTRYDLSKAVGRGGLLTQGSTLTIGGDEASMVARGLFVLHDVLRGAVSDPPPCVDTTPVPTRPGLTQRMIATERIANPSCGGCHGKFETLAFGLERFDGTGAYHLRDEHGNELREDGTMLVPGEEMPVAYANSRELMDLLAGSARVRETITWKILQFALGRPLRPGDQPFLRQIHQAAQEHGGTYASTIMAIATNELFQSIHTERTQ